MNRGQFVFSCLDLPGYFINIPVVNISGTICSSTTQPGWFSYQRDVIEFQLSTEAVMLTDMLFHLSVMFQYLRLKARICSPPKVEAQLGIARFGARI
jgi:hypothetical protein